MPPRKKNEVEKKILLGRPKGTLKMGLVGLPNVGKSTTFNLLSKQSVPAENYPFCTIDPSEARLNVDDPKFEKLCAIFKPKSRVSASLSVFDIAGLVSGAHKGEGLGNAFLSHIQSVDGIYHVVRAFDNEEIIHTEGSIDPVRDMQIISNELRLKDLERLEKKIEELKKSTARAQDKTKKLELDILIKIFEWVDSGKWISANDNWNTKEIALLNEYCFLTAKPLVYLVNMSKKDFLRQRNKYLQKIAEWIDANNPGKIIIYSAEFENDWLEMSEEARIAFIKENPKINSCVNKIITTGYKALNLIHYFTCGADEVKCWTIRQSTKAPQAAGIIHSDMEDGFICAEVMKYDDLVQYGTEVAVKAEGKVYTKGKDYIVEENDIMFFKFNPAKNKK